MKSLTTENTEISEFPVSVPSVLSVVKFMTLQKVANP
jgi:hypothetical protein